MNAQDCVEFLLLCCVKTCNTSICVFALKQMHLCTFAFIVYLLNAQGTVEFIAPELISCKTASTSSDMWSGYKPLYKYVLYDMLSGYKPIYKYILYDM